MAIITRNGQYNVDCILLILLWDSKICEHVITGSLVRFTACKVDAINQANISFFPETVEYMHGSAGRAVHQLSYGTGCIRPRSQDGHEI
jgi:hypothetical protein